MSNSTCGDAGTRAASTAGMGSPRVAFFGLRQLAAALDALQNNLINFLRRIG
jgi:hypothetical protein